MTDKKIIIKPNGRRFHLKHNRDILEDLYNQGILSTVELSELFQVSTVSINSQIRRFKHGTK
nr:Phosphoribosylglycinamide formyltransferase 2-5'-phosphoribosylglycinamide transformylase 2-Formate-dependent GAR transformylase-GAR transformylase 2 [Moritella viscosa]